VKVIHGKAGYIPTYKWKLYSVHGKAGYIPTYKWKLYSVHGKAGYISTYMWHLYSTHGKEAVFLHTSDTYTAYMVKRAIFLRITEREAQMYHIIVMWIDQIAIIFRNFDITNKKVDI
jgi:hypothetical protein